MRQDMHVYIDADTPTSVGPRGRGLRGAMLIAGTIEKDRVQFTFTSEAKLRETVAQLQELIDTVCPVVAADEKIVPMRRPTAYVGDDGGLPPGAA